MARKGQAMPTTVIPSYRAKVSDGKSVKVVADQDVEVSKFYEIQGFLGAAFQEAKKGDDVVLNIEQGVYETDQLGDGAFEAGTPIYFADGEFNETAGRYAGIVTQEKDEDGVILFLLAPQTPSEAPEGGNA